MARQSRIFNINNVTPDNQRAVFAGVDQDLSALFQSINLIAFGSPVDGIKLKNMDAVFVVYTTPAGANTDQLLQHKLGRIPVGLIPISLPIIVGEVPTAADVYFGSVTPTATAVTVRCAAISIRRAFILF